MVQLELHLVGVGQAAGGVEAVEVGVDDDHVGALGGEGHRGVAAAGAEHQEALALGGAEQAQRRLVGDVGPVDHDVDGQLGVGGEGGDGRGPGGGRREPWSVTGASLPRPARRAGGPARLWHRAPAPLPAARCRYPRRP